MKEFATQYMIINSADIKRAAYQRIINPRRAQQIADHWDETQANEPKLSFRDGCYWIFDGQHTLAARKMKAGGKDIEVRSKVYFGMTYEDEALTFAHQQDLNKRVEANAKVNAEFEGKDKDVINMVAMSESVGLKISFNGGEADNQINAVETALSIFKKRGAPKYLETLNIILAAWGGTYQSFNSAMLRGVSEFISKYETKYDRKNLIHKLEQTHPIKIMRDAKLRVGSRTKVCDEICEVYNKRLQNKLEIA